MKDALLLEQKPLVDSYLDRHPRPLSGFSFVSLFAWCDFFDFELKTIGNCLCIFAHGEAGSFLYLPPLGEFDASVIRSVFDQMARTGTSKKTNRIENIPGNLLSAFGQGSYNQYDRPAEYVYRKEDLIALKGNAYKSQRHDCNCFMSHQGGYSFGPYAEGDLDACIGLYERWADNRSQSNSDEIYRCMLRENRLVHARLLRSCRTLGLVVRVLRLKDEVIGYTFGFGLDEDTFCVYAEIADLKAPGAAAYMFRAFCAEEELKKFSRINTMDDFAMPNVARAKQAYHPSELISSYTVSLKVQ